MSYCVAIPAFNAARTIKETLDSVLNQSVAPSEIVVVDDGSSDDTPDIVAQYGADVRLIRQQNAGCGAATTAAIMATSAPVVAMVDADDVWLPEKMERQLARLDQLGARSLVFARIQQFPHGNSDRTAGKVRDGLMRSTMVMARSAFDAVGPIIDPPGGCGDMVDWIGRARGLGFAVDVLPEVLAQRRIIAGSMTYAMTAEQNRGYLAVARAAILRRRQG